MLWQYFICNERLEIFLTCFCNILCYVGHVSKTFLDEKTKNSSTRLLIVNFVKYKINDVALPIKFVNKKTMCRFSLHREVLKLWSTQTFGWECTCHIYFRIAWGAIDWMQRDANKFLNSGVRLITKRS